MITTGIGFDVHGFAAGRPLILGGVEVREGGGLMGHSDADVLTHAVIDALLGSISDGDIGTHFPDTDAEYKDIASTDLLKRVIKRLRERGAKVVHTDATVIAQAPRLAPFVDAMRESLAAAMDVPVGRVSVKAKTTERLGPIGREEGIAALAVATVERVDREGNEAE